MKKTLISILSLLITSVVFSQTVEEKLNKLQQNMERLDQQKVELQEGVDELKLEKIREDILKVSQPEIKTGEEVLVHSAMSLVYSEQHEQAKWVAQIITPDIINGTTGRSNDFREDPLVKTGSATEKDYFLKALKAGSTDKYDYDGFGYDRGLRQL